MILYPLLDDWFEAFFMRPTSVGIALGARAATRI